MEEASAIIIPYLTQPHTPPYYRGWVLRHSKGYIFTILYRNKHYFVNDEMYENKLDARTAMITWMREAEQEYNRRTIDN